MTIEVEKIKKKKNYYLQIVLLITFTIFLVYFYNVLINYGSSHLLALLILFFFTLLFIGLLVKGKEIFSLFKHKRYNNQQNEKERYLKEFETHHVRRIDHIKLDSKYRKPIIRKCPNCGMLLPHFVKKCPNCGEVIVS
ncbi:MAG: zinc ribbon domain-containing protein [Promethearchaeota archaeon]